MEEEGSCRVVSKIETTLVEFFVWIKTSAIRGCLQASDKLLNRAVLTLCSLNIDFMFYIFRFYLENQRY
jgi:hypothetical protein